MGSHCRQREHMSARNDDRSSVGKGIGRRACRRANYQSVSLIGRHIVAINSDVNANHRGIVTLQDSHVVQCTIVALNGFPFRLHTNHRTGIYRIVALVQRINGMFYLLGIHIGQESQASCIDSQDGYLLVAHLAGSTKESTVTSHREDEVGFKLSSIKDTNTLNR